MLNHPADEFIMALSTTVRDYKSKVEDSRELEDLLDMSSHMIAALDALRSRQLSAHNSAGSE